MDRRKFLAMSSMTAAWFLTGCGGGSSASGLDTATQGTSKLIIPPLLEPTDIGGIKHYNIAIQKATHTFIDGFSTATYAMNGTYLGPTLKLTNGESVSINYTNQLDETTTMHGHGMHVPAVMDGAAHQVIAVNTTFSAKYTVNQKACTNWYHPHLMGKTAEHVYKGLAGLMIIEDTEIQALDLPKTYGIDDIPLILQDRFFTSTGQLDYSPSMREIMHGYNGDTFIANGVINAYLDVEAKEVRFRILNGSNSTVYNLAFSDGRSFKQIATDNSLLNAPVSLTNLLLSPAERAEIVVDLSDLAEQTITLKDTTQNKAFLTVNVKSRTSAVTTTPALLTNLNVHFLSDAVNTRSFTLSGNGPGQLVINGVAMDMSVINERVPLGQVEIWEVTNTMGMNHNFHIHATHFTIAERNGSAANVADNEKGYKDTVFLAANDTVKLLVQMTDYTDATKPYMYHCHFLEHEDAGMMGQFTVELFSA
jgi:FtsP/CotA-like multicopper oxidase with cupredoxin domain